MSSTDAVTPSLEVATELPRLRELLRQQRFTEVLAAGNTLLAEEPSQRDALLFVAVAQRYLGRVPEALTTLATLERNHPDFSRLHEERGHCFVFLKSAPDAIAAFLRAVNLNHALPASWRMLEGLYRMTGQRDERQMAADHVATLQKIPPDVVTATGLFADGDFDAAEIVVRAYLLKHGDHIEAMRLLARIGIRRRVFDDAELLLAAVLQIAPTYRAARQEYAGVLVDLHKHAQAHEQLKMLLSDEPENRVFRTLLAATTVGLGDHARAIELYVQLLQGGETDADVHLSIAHALKTLGRTAAAIDSYRKAADSRPDFGDAYWSLANLKTYRFTDEELARLRAAEASPSSKTTDRYHLCFALGKALEDRGEYATSFHSYALGNRLKRAESNYSAELIETNTRQQIEVCTASLFNRHRGSGAPEADPIFIIGLPRSGSTLIEQILASHSQVQGTQELANIQHLVHNLRGRDPDPQNPRYPRILADLKDEELRLLGQRYLAETLVYRTVGIPHFIDKMPNNFRHLGLIHLILPNAKIIDARREPMACCFSNFKQLFANGQEFTYSIEDIARYYRTYLQLMSHWNAVLPGRVLRVQHEDLVDDLEDQVRGILDFCQLEFEAPCIEFYKTERSVRTASSEQVRQPIYREGLEQWRHFEQWLVPLKETLGDALQKYRDV